MGFAVLAIDYRGFGRSDGELPSEAQAYDDAQAAWQHLRLLEPDPRRRFAYGHSLGGAVAIELATRNDDVAGLIVESTFTSMADMAEKMGYGNFPIGLVLTQRFDSLAKVRGGEGAGAVRTRHVRPVRAGRDERATLCRRARAEAAAARREREPQQRRDDGVRESTRRRCATSSCWCGTGRRAPARRRAGAADRVLRPPFPRLRPRSRGARLARARRRAPRSVPCRRERAGALELPGHGAPATGCS